MPFDLATAKPVEEERPQFDLASAKPVTEAPAERSAPEQVLRAVGRTARAGIKGAVAIPGMLANAVAAPYNIAADFFNERRAPTAGELVTGKERGFRFPDQTQFGERIADALGLPKPENATERVAEDVAGGMAGAGGMVKGAQAVSKAASPIVARIGELLKTAPGTQIVAGGTGPGAAGVVREEGGGPVAQIGAGVAGTALPSIGSAAAAAARGLLRGGEAGRQAVADNIKTFEDSGAGTPTVGQATEGRGARAVETVLSRTPGSAGRIAAKAEDEASGIGSKIEDMAAQVAPRTGAAPAGRQIRGGLEQFVDEFKGQSGKLYDALDTHIPKDTTVDVANTRAALEKLNADIPGAPNLSKWFKNAKIQGIEGAMDKDAPATQAQPIISQILGPSGEQLVTGQTPAKAAGLPYEALKKLRTLVGNEMSDATIASDVPASKWRPLYAALSKDMAAAARGAGPKAEAAFVRANNFHRAGMQRLEDVLTPILKKGDPEDIFQAAISGTKEGASTIAGVMKSLPTESRKAVAGTMLRRLGIATPGKQNELGETFSTETFLTNWNKLHPDAKRVLFAPLSDGMRSDLDKIAKVAANVREGSKVFANPSGTAQASAAHLTAGAFAVSLLTGQLGTAAAIAGGVGIANATGRLMTSPKFVHWLAESTKAPIEQLPAQLNNLFQQSLYMRGDERKDARAFVKEAREAARQPRGATE
jgi:hypothetical protein